MAVRPVPVELGSKLEDDVLADIAYALLNDTPVLLKINIPKAMQTVVYDAIMELKQGGDFEKNVLNKKETVMNPQFTTIPYMDRAKFPKADELWRSVCKSLNAMPQNYTGETFVGGALVETDQVVEHTNSKNIWHGAPVQGVRVSGASKTSNPRLKTNEVAEVDQKFYTSKTKASTKAHWHAPPVINYHFYGSTKKVYRFCAYNDSNKTDRFRCGPNNESHILGYEIGSYQEANAIIFPHGMVHEIETHIDYERSFNTDDPIDVLTYSAETDDVKHYLGLGTYIMLDVVIADRVSFVQKVLFDIKGMSKKPHWKQQFSGTTILELQDVFQNIHDVWLNQLGKTKKILHQNTTAVGTSQPRKKSPKKCFEKSASSSGAPLPSLPPPSSASSPPPSSATSLGKRPSESSVPSSKRQLTPYEQNRRFLPTSVLRNPTRSSKRSRADSSSTPSAAGPPSSSAAASSAAASSAAASSAAASSAAASSAAASSAAASSAAAQDDDYDDEDTTAMQEIRRHAMDEAGQTSDWSLVFSVSDVTDVPLGAPPDIGCVWKHTETSVPLRATFEIRAHKMRNSEMFVVFSDDKNCNHVSGSLKTITFCVSTFPTKFRIRNWYRDLPKTTHGYLHHLSKVTTSSLQKAHVIPFKQWVKVEVDIYPTRLKYTANGIVLSNVNCKPSAVPKAGFFGFSTFDQAFQVKNIKLYSLSESSK